MKTEKIIAELKDDGEVYFLAKKIEGKKYIYICWNGFVNEAKAKAGMIKELELLEEYNVSGILNDNTNITGPYPSNIFDWINTTWIPQVKSRKKLKIANLVSHQIFSKFSAQQLERKIEDVVYKNFENKDNAEAWLSE